MTQNETIKRHLLEHGFISTWEAIKNYKITRLSARIKEIEEEGFEFGRVWQSNKETRWVEYHLMPGDKERAEKLWKV